MVAQLVINRKFLIPGPTDCNCPRDFTLTWRQQDQGSGANRCRTYFTARRLDQTQPRSISIYAFVLLQQYEYTLYPAEFWATDPRPQGRGQNIVFVDHHQRTSCSQGSADPRSITIGLIASSQPVEDGSGISSGLQYEVGQKHTTTRSCPTKLTTCLE